VDLGAFDVESTNEFFAFALINPSDITNCFQRIFSKANATSEAGHWFMLGQQHNDIRARLKAGGSTQTLVGNDNALSLNTWHSIAMRYNGASLRVDIDAGPWHSVSKTGNVDVDSSVSVAIGNQGEATGDDWWNNWGSIALVGVWSRYWTDSQLLMFHRNPFFFLAPIRRTYFLFTSVGGAIKNLTAQADAVSTVTAAIEITRELTAQADALSTVTADLTVLHDLTAQADATSVVTAAIEVTRELPAAQADAVSVVAADLTVLHDLTAQADGLSTVTAALGATRPLTAQADGLSVVTAAIENIRPLSAAQADGLSVVTAVLSKLGMQLLTAQADATSTVTVALGAIRELTAQADALSVVAADLTELGGATKSLTAQADALSVVTVAGLTALHDFTAATEALSVVAADLTVLHDLAAATEALSVVAADLQAIRGLTAAAPGAAVVTAVLERIRDLTAGVDAASGVTITGPQLTREFAATVTAGATVTAAFQREGLFVENLDTDFTARTINKEFDAQSKVDFTAPEV
jgi:hypothetical protein